MTSSSRPLARLGGGALVAACLATAIGLQIARERWAPMETPAEQVLYVRSPAVMSRLTLSFDSVLADLYWIRAIQTYGGIRLAPDPVKHYDLLYPLLDLTTTLDPDFRIAYRFGAFFLSERAPGGAGRPDLAIALLTKAMAAQPDRWEYPHDIGFVYYREGDYRTAAAWFQRASRLPGAANWLAPLAAVTLATGGDVASSRVLWQHLLAESDQDWLTRTAAYRLQQLDTIDAMARIARITADYARQHGAPPASWDVLVRERRLPGVPADAAGYPLVLDPQRGSVTVRPDSPMWPLPTEGAR